MTKLSSSTLPSVRPKWATPYPLIQDLAQLLLRILLSYGFYAPFIVKITHVENFSRWLERMHFSYPLLNAWLVIGLQGASVVLFAIGLCTRPLAIGLILHLLIGLFAVHWPNGFSARDNGYEIPLYYVLILFYLAIMGAGRFSVDHLIRRYFEKRGHRC